MLGFSRVLTPTDSLSAPFLTFGYESVQLSLQVALH